MEECLFCRIVKGEIPSEKIYEDEKVYAFSDVDPKNRRCTCSLSPKNIWPM